MLGSAFRVGIMSISGLFTKQFERFPDYQGDQTKRNFSSRTDVFLKGPLFAKSSLNLARFEKFCFRPYGREIWFKSPLCVLRFHCPCRTSAT